MHVSPCSPHPLNVCLFFRLNRSPAGTTHAVIVNGADTYGTLARSTHIVAAMCHVGNGMYSTRRIYFKNNLRIDFAAWCCRHVVQPLL